MGLFDFLGIGQPDWCDSEETISKLLSDHLAKNNLRWAQLSTKEQQERLTHLIGKFSDRIEWFLMKTMGKPAFVNEFAFRFVGRSDISEELKDKVLNVGVQNNTAIEVDTRQFPDRYNTLTGILYHFYQASGQTNKNLRSIWKDFLNHDLQ